jgi:protein-L-isoaspartate(D-aspartate) O-methyltransferase
MILRRKDGRNIGEGKSSVLLFIFHFSFCIVVLPWLSCSSSSQVEDDYSTLRELMVENQIVARGVQDSLVLEAIGKVPRHLFVPLPFQQRAYSDGALPIGENQTITQPYIVALMTDLLDLSGGDKVLEIGTGSGYQAAVLAEIAGEVYSIEIIEILAESAEIRLNELGYENIQVRWGDGYKGWKEHAPFDGIIVTAAPDHIPEPLIEQLKVGGKMVIPVGDLYQELLLVEKTEEGVHKKSVIPVRFVPMTGEAEMRSSGSE